MEQQIRFCTAPDGTQLAYAMYDEGGKTPLVLVASWRFSQELFWELPEGRAFYERLAQGRKLVTFDRRGVGASQREIEDLSVDAQLSDLVAIVDHLRLVRFDVLSFNSATTVPFAAENPERVRRLIFWGPARTPKEDTTRLQDTHTMLELIRRNWQLARRSIAGLEYPNGPVEKQRWLSAVLRESISPEVAARFIESLMAFDIEPFLSRVTSPTIILHRRGDRFTPISGGRAVAARIPDARFVALEGDIGSPLVDDHLQIAELIVQFLDEGEEEQALTVPVPTGLVTILFTDMESSTALTQRLGDAGAQEVRRAHNAIVRDALKHHGGQEIKHTGDGIMASFPTTSAALECAIAIQQGVASHKEEHPDSLLAVYIGLNAGEPIAEEGDLFGTSINLAARICDHAEPAQILASDVVRQLAAGKQFLFSHLGDTELRGFEDPVKLWEVRWRAET